MSRSRYLTCREGTIVDGIQEAGSKGVMWNAGSVESGIFFCGIVTTSSAQPQLSFSQTKEIVPAKEYVPHVPHHTHVV